MTNSKRKIRTNSNNNRGGSSSHLRRPLRLGRQAEDEESEDLLLPESNRRLGRRRFIQMGRRPSEPLKLLSDTIQNTVDKLAALVGPIAFGDLDRFVEDRRPWRSPLKGQLKDR